MIVYGTRPYGKCDVVPELFYVATWFFHVNYVPLVPTGSRLVLGQSGDTYHVIEIPLSFKSVLLAWGRTVFFFAAVAGVLWAGDTLLDPKHARETGVLLPICVALFNVAVYTFLMVYPRRTMPSYERASRLATRAGLNERGWAALNVLYGRDPLDRPGQGAATDVLKVG